VPNATALHKCVFTAACNAIPGYALSLLGEVVDADQIESKDVFDLVKCETYGWAKLHILNIVESSKAIVMIFCVGEVRAIVH
jgi:hypothetical protein